MIFGCGLSPTAWGTFHKASRPFNGSKAVAIPLVTPVAIGEITDAESPVVVMATHAALGARRGVMHERLRRSDLPTLRQSRTDVVTFIAAESLSPVFGVAEIDSVAWRPFGSPYESSALMARAA